MKYIKRIGVFVLIIFMTTMLVACEKNDSDNRYTITFKVNDTIYETKQVQSGEKVEKPTNPTVLNYLFEGWYVDDEKWSFLNNTVDRDLTLTAKFDYGYEYYGTKVMGLTDYGKSLSKIYILDGMTEIAARAFKGELTLEEIDIPNSVKSIGDNAFYNCDVLTNVSFGENSKLNSIGDDAFSGCDKLKNITIPSNVNSIGEYAFSFCEGLTNIVIPSSVKTIGERAFCGCYKLTSVTFENTNDWNVIKEEDYTFIRSISSSELSNKSTAATYLKSDYYNYYWERG